MIEYIITVVLIAAIYAIFSLGLNLEWGFTGLINFGHVAFMAIGAYTTVLLNLNGVALFPSVIAGMALAGLCGGLLGIPALKLRADYLAIVTLGFAEIVRFIRLNEEWLTRGPMGLHGYSRPFEDFISGDYNFFLLLLLDEPFSGVNPTLTKRILEYLKTLREEGMTFLVIEHDMHIIMQLSDFLYVLNKGKVIASGVPEEVRHNERVLDAYLG